MWIRFLLLTITTIASIGIASLETIAAPSSKTAQKQETQAKLSYSIDENEFLSNFRIEIQRQGQTLINAALPIEQLPGYSPDHPLRANQADIQAIDLNADREPEVIVDVNQAGSRCCTFSVIYGYDKRTQNYRAIAHFWGNYTSGYWMEGLTGKSGDRNLVDLNRDGHLEFIALDDRFRGEFGSFAASAAPVQIWRYQEGNFVNVTREFPSQIRESARFAWRQYERMRREINPQVAKGAMAAYVGAKTLLGEQEDAMKRLHVGYPNDPSFRNDLLQFLRKTNYLR